LLFFLLPAPIVAVLLLPYGHSAQPVYVGLYPYLGEKKPDLNVSSEILNTLWGQWKFWEQ